MSGKLNGKYPYLSSDTKSKSLLYSLMNSIQIKLFSINFYCSIKTASDIKQTQKTQVFFLIRKIKFF